MIEGLAHPVIFNRKTKSSIIVKDTEAIADYLKILLLSPQGSLLADPNYGCSLKLLVFNPNDQSIIDLVKDYIVQAIRIYGQSIVVDYNDISITIDEDEINITISYRMSEYFKSSTFTLNILQSEVING